MSTLSGFRLFWLAHAEHLVRAGEKKLSLVNISEVTYEKI